jgi:hypothetical protein
VRRALLLATALALLAAPAPAHRGRSTLSVVVIDAATGQVTVTHRMAAHDVEPALVDIAPRAQPSLDDPDALAALIRYAGRAFMLSDASGRVALTHKATDLAGDDVRLTYVGRVKLPATAVTVDSNLFQESHADQENQVNVRRAKRTLTALFRPGSEPRRLSFD